MTLEIEMVEKETVEIGAVGKSIGDKKKVLRAKNEQPEGDQANRPGLAAATLGKVAEVGLAEVSLSTSQFRLLAFLAEGTAASSALAGRLTVTPPSVTAAINGLVSRGLVERSHALDDRRRVDHVITDQGREVLRAAEAAVDGILYEFVEYLGDDELAERALEGLGLWWQAVLNRRTTNPRYRR